MRPGRAALKLLVVGLLAPAACENSPELPTAAEGEVPFSRVVWDRLDMKPEPGTTLRVGDVMDYGFRAFFEFAGTQEENEYSSASLDFDASLFYAAPSNTWSFPVTLFSKWQGLDEGTTKGTIEASGQFTIPRFNTFCGKYERIAVNANIGYETEQPLQKSEKNTASGLEVAVTYPVVGSTNPVDPCAYYKYWTQKYTWVWGEPIEWTKVVNVAEDDVISVIFGEGRPAMIWNSVFEEGFDGIVAFFPSSLELDVIIPVGSTGGEQRVLVTGKPADWGTGLASRFPIPEKRDFGDPHNDRWTTPEEDTWSFPRSAHVTFWGPELSMTQLDRRPDPTANPLGLTEYGRGDWWTLAPEDSYELCVVVESRHEDAVNVDAFLFDASGAQLAATKKEGVAHFPDGDYDQEWLRLNVEAGTNLLLWVAPRSVATEDGWYGMLAQDCAYFDIPPLTAPDLAPGASPSRTPAVRPSGIARR